jgi:hypothetical protein
MVERLKKLPKSTEIYRNSVFSFHFVSASVVRTGDKTPKKSAEKIKIQNLDEKLKKNSENSWKSGFLRGGMRIFNEFKIWNFRCVSVVCVCSLFLLFFWKVSLLCCVLCVVSVNEMLEL